VAGTGAGGAPPSGVTITLGGVAVPKEKAIAFIHIGHSNMAGRATVPQASRAYHFMLTDPHAWMYHPGSMPALAIEPKTAGDEDGAGPGTSLVKQAAALAPSSYFISLGWAKASAYCSQFVPGGLYYDQLIKGPLAIKDRVTFGAIFIYLGITERHGTAADRNGYAQCINTLVTKIRTDVGVPDLPLLINDYEVEATGELAVGTPEYNAIAPQIKQIPTVVSNSALVPCDGLGMQDDHHFNLDGQFTWVQRALATMQQKGWFHWQ
jgi:glycerophosphoryl diester phosphodiesterase